MMVAALVQFSGGQWQKCRRRGASGATTIAAISACQLAVLRTERSDKLRYC